MSKKTEHKECECGSKDRITEYDSDTQEGYEFCDVCSSYLRVQIINIPKHGMFPIGWIPEYKKANFKTGYVLKIWQKGADGFMTSAIEKSKLKSAIEELKKDDRVKRFAITFKDGKGNYQTQIYK